MRLSSARSFPPSAADFRVVTCPVRLTVVHHLIEIFCGSQSPQHRFIPMNSSVCLSKVTFGSGLTDRTLARSAARPASLMAKFSFCFSGATQLPYACSSPPVRCL